MRARTPARSRSILGITILASSLLTACEPSRPAITEPDDANRIGALPAPAWSASHANTSHAVARPFKGSCDLSFEVLELKFPVLRQRDTGTCQLSHLGRSQFDGELVINLIAGTQVGTRTFTAANGDQLYANVLGTSAPAGPGLIGFSAIFTFTGGTGRFANASGTANGAGVANQITKTTTVSIEGTLSY